MSIGRGIAIMGCMACATVAVVFGHGVFAAFMGFGGLIVACR
jgi:hypothetical protein